MQGEGGGLDEHHPRTCFVLLAEIPHLLVFVATRAALRQEPHEEPAIGYGTVGAGGSACKP